MGKNKAKELVIIKRELTSAKEQEETQSAWLIKVRWFNILILLFGTVMFQIIMEAQRVNKLGFSAFFILYILIAVAVCLNYFLWVLLKKFTNHKNFNYLQVTSFLVLYTIFIHFTGGADSPFILLYILEIGAFSFFLPPIESFIMASLAWFLYIIPVKLEAYSIINYINFSENLIIHYKDDTYIIPMIIRTAGLSYLAVLIGSYLGNTYHFYESEIKKALQINKETGLYTYNYFKKQLDLEIKRSERYFREVSLVLIGIDNFAQIEDKNKKKEIFKKLAALTISCFREVDICCHYKEDTIGLILCETFQEGALIAVERLKKQMKEKMKTDPEITISTGIVTFPQDSKNTEELLTKLEENFAKASKIN